jgi:cysteine desulfurase
VLLAMGLEPGIAQGAVRFSLGRENTVEQVDYVVAALQNVIKPLQTTLAF